MIKDNERFTKVTPLGHMSTSYIISKKAILIISSYMLIGGIFPDIDFLAYFFDNLNETHRTFSHSILFIGLVSLFIYFFTKQDIKKSLSFFFGGVLHIFVDSILDSNYSNGIGTQMFWPLSCKFYTPFTLLSNNPMISWDNPYEFIKSNIFMIILIELPFWIWAFLLYKESKHE